MGFSNVLGVPRWGQGEVGAPRVIDGREVAAAVRGEVAAEVSALVAAGGRAPGLATLLVGADEASQVYVGAKHRACAEAGIKSIDRREPADCTPERLAAAVAELNADPEVDGILLQLPLPAGLDGTAFVDLIDPAKDVDGLSTASTGALWRSQPGLRPCTPSGVMKLLQAVGADPAGVHAVIVGRSELVGRPLAAMLLGADATVTVCHSRTRDLAAVCSRADILVAAVGRPRMIGPEHVRRGAVVVDVGINRTEDGLVGDVDYERVLPLASAITPVPGGVGPMTIACLLRNTLRAAERSRAAEALTNNQGS